MISMLLQVMSWRQQSIVLNNYLSHCSISHSPLLQLRYSIMNYPSYEFETLFLLSSEVSIRCHWRISPRLAGSYSMKMESERDAAVGRECPDICLKKLTLIALQGEYKDLSVCSV